MHNRRYHEGLTHDYVAKLKQQAREESEGREGQSPPDEERERLQEKKTEI